MKKLILLMALFISSLSLSLQAQKLLKPFDTVSHKKTAYIVMEDGSELECRIKKLKRKKGLIKQVNVKDANDKVTEISIEDIKYAYFPQSGWDKMTKVSSYINDATQWNDDLYSQERIQDGYAYFEKAEVMVKKNKMTLLVQLLNPGTCSRIKVYHDPFAKETIAPSIGGFKVAGGDDKSYYISKDGKVSFRLVKKKYKKTFDDIFGDCKTVKKRYSGGKWNEFVKALFAFNEKCTK